MPLTTLGSDNLTYVSANSTAEAVVTDQPAILIAIIPNFTTTGTITLRDAATTGGSNVQHVAAIGLTQQGKQFGNGVRFMNGITVQKSVGTDIVGIVWAPFKN